MRFIPIESIEQLSEMIAQGHRDFCIASGVARSGKYITKNGNIFRITHYIDGSEEGLTAEQLANENIGKAINNGTFYCEIMED